MPISKSLRVVILTALLLALLSPSAFAQGQPSAAPQPQAQASQPLAQASPQSQPSAQPQQAQPQQAQPQQGQGQSPVSVSAIAASVFPNPTDSGAFIATPSTAVTFTQDFPVFNFNPPPNTLKCTPPSTITPDTTPFTDVIPQPDGSCKTVVMAGNGQQAAVGDLRNFQVVFTGNFQVSTPGRVTFSVWSDDGWILSIGPGSGGQPGYVSGPMLNFPRVGPFTGYTIVGSYNLESAPNQNNLVVGFPAAGTYPFELDYSDCCEGTQALTIFANGAPIPPADAAGGPVAAPPSPQAAASPVAGASPVVAAAPTTPPAAATTLPSQNNDLMKYLPYVGVALVLLIAGALLLFFLVLRKPKPKPAAVVVAAEPPAPVEDRTEYIGRVPLTDLTMVSNRRPQVLPKAKLLLKPDREIQLSRAADTVIGRDPANTAFVDDRQVSRHHAKITSVDGEFWIEDLNSTNGTRVNGATVTRQKLANNDQITVGDTILTYNVESS